MFLVLKIIKLLNSDANPAQVAGGALIGCMLGMAPLIGTNMAHVGLLFAFLLVFRVNIGTGLLFWGATKPLMFLIQPTIGIPLGAKLVLEGSTTRSWVQTLLETPGLALVEWETHAVTGGLVCGAILGLLLFIPIVSFINAYRTMVKERIRKSKALGVASNSLVGKIFKGILEGTPE